MPAETHVSTFGKQEVVLEMLDTADNKGKDYWIDLVLEQKDIGEIINFLQSITGKPIIITDYLGRVYAHSPERKMSSPDDHYLELPLHNQTPFYFEPNSRTLYYHTGFTEKDACILIKDVDNAADIEDWKIPFEDVSVAIKIYLSMARETEKIKNQLTHQMLEDILIRNVCNIKEIARQYTWLLDLNKLYYVSILEPEPISETKMNILHGHTREWLKYHDLDIICSVWKNQFIVFICPTHFDRQTLEADWGWERHLNNIRKHQKDIANRFHISTSFGIGRKYPLPELHKSYQEALIALNVSKLTGKKNFIKHFLDLGVFSILNYQEITQLKQFCLTGLGKLLEHDRSTKGELLTTLRILCDTNFDVSEAAQKMFIHFNTMRYRIKKIEELTGTKLEQIEDKLNLFVAVKLYDLLILNGLFGEGIDAKNLHPSRT